MTLRQSFEVVEPAVKRALPGHAFAPAWCTMWLEQNKIDEPSARDIETAIKAYRRRVGATIN